ncbi:WD repeat-containing protein 62 isoform X1 [Ixodes scapularis]
MLVARVCGSYERERFSPQGSQLTFTRKHHVVGKTTLYDMEVDGPQEYVLAACQDRNVRVYSVASGKNTRCFRGAQGEDGTLIKVVLDSTGTYLATSCTDKSLYVYEYGSGECVASMFGHSELVTGLKFTEDGRHLISVSGDGCIFMWRLPENVTQAIVSRRTGVPLPTSWQEARKSAIAVTKPLPAADKEEVESALPPPLASRVDAKEDHGERSPEYKFSMGPLPMWAKRQMMEMNNNGPSNSSAANQNGQPPVPQPRGRWAQRIDAARSIFEGGDRASSFTASVNGKGDSPTKREAGNADDDFEVCPKSLQEIEQPSLSLHKLPSGRVTQRGTGDRNRCPTDSSSAASSTRMEDGDAEDEHSDTEGSEMVFYPHSEEGSEGGDSAFQVRATTEVDLKEARRRLHRVRPDRPDRPARDPPSLYSSVTDFASELNSDEEDSSTAAEGEPGVPRPLGGSMCVSTDNLDKLGQREKFMKSNYESLDHSGMESGLDSTLTPVAALRSSISAKATALALISGSVDISGMVTPSLVQLLVDRYNFSGCLLIMAGLSLNLFIACIFLRRPSWIEDRDDLHTTITLERSLTSGIDGTGMILKADSHTSAKIPAEDINRRRGDDGSPLRTTKAPHKLKEGILRSWFGGTVSLATVPRGSATRSVDGVAKFGSQRMLHRKGDFDCHGSTLELDTGSLIAERSNQLGDAAVVKSKTETRLEAPSQGDVARPDKRATPDEIEERGFLNDTTESSLTVSDSGISKTGFLQKLRSVSSVYTWTVCVSKGASNFSSYTFALVAIDYAHDVGVLGQKAALLPALFSSGCLVATLVTGPAVDRNLVSRHSALMVSFVVQAGALISVSTIRSFLVLALGSFLVGLGRGVRCFLFPVLVSNHCRLDDMPAALSIMNAVCSVVLFLRTPLIGASTPELRPTAFMRNNNKR